MQTRKTCLRWELSSTTNLRIPNRRLHYCQSQSDRSSSPSLEKLIYYVKVSTKTFIDRRGESITMTASSRHFKPSTTARPCKTSFRTSSASVHRVPPLHPVYPPQTEGLPSRSVQLCSKLFFCRSISVSYSSSSPVIQPFLPLTQPPTIVVESSVLPRRTSPVYNLRSLAPIAPSLDVMLSICFDSFH
jgi:hypothetical protein